MSQQEFDESLLGLRNLNALGLNNARILRAAAARYGGDVDMHDLHNANSSSGSGSDTELIAGVTEDDALYNGSHIADIDD